MNSRRRTTTSAAPGSCTAEAGRGGTQRSPLRVLRSNLGAVGVMMTAVCLQIVGAVLLKTIADHRVDWSILVLAGGVGMVICLNLIRLGVWGFAHKHFPLSTTFPLSSLFYPAMLIVAAGFGDEIGVRQVVGALLIASGTMWLSTRVPT